MSGPISKKRKAEELSSSAVQPPKSKNEQTKPGKDNAPEASKNEIPPLEPLETLVAAYLRERNFGKTLKAFEKETSKKFDAASPSVNLQSIWENYQKDNTPKAKQTNGVNDAAASIAAQIRSGMSKVAEKVTPKNDESEESEASSEDESSEEESDSDDEEDDESSEESESEDSSAESESESASESEVDQRPTKKRVQEIKGRKKALPVQESESSSSSSSSSESESDSDAEPTTNGATTNGASDKMELDEDDTSSSSSSESESDSEAEPTTKPVNGTSHAETAVPNGTTPAQKRAPIEEFSSPAEVKRQKKTNEPFSRIPKDQLVDPRFSSNKYNSYDYAERAHQDLIVTKGKGFTKEKNKKKKGSYRGGIIDIGGSKAVKFD